MTKAQIALAVKSLTDAAIRLRAADGPTARELEEAERATFDALCRIRRMQRERAHA